MKMQHSFLILLLLLSMVCAVCVEARQVQHGDAASKDPSLNEFRSRLRKALHDHDAAYVKSVLAKNVMYGLGGGIGKAQFLSNYDNLKKNSEFWSRLDQALANGGKYTSGMAGSKKVFHCPYALFDNLSDKEEELGTDWAVVNGKDISFQEEPDKNAPSLAKLSYELVQIPDDKPAKGQWMKVIYHKDQSGYVERRNLILRSEPFAELQKQGGAWRILWFGAASP
jgi:hypothetical protein